MQPGPSRWPCFVAMVALGWLFGGATAYGQWRCGLRARVRQRRGACRIAAALRLATATGMPKRWGWTLACLVGLITLSLDWTSGGVHVNMLSFQILGAGANKAGPAAPWIISFSLPLGAVLALQRYRAWRAAAMTPMAHSPTASDG